MGLYDSRCTVSGHGSQALLPYRYHSAVSGRSRLSAWGTYCAREPSSRKIKHTKYRWEISKVVARSLRMSRTTILQYYYCCTATLQTTDGCCSYRCVNFLRCSDDCCRFPTTAARTPEMIQQNYNKPTLHINLILNCRPKLLH